MGSSGVGAGMLSCGPDILGAKALQANLSLQSVHVIMYGLIPASRLHVIII